MIDFDDVKRMTNDELLRGVRRAADEEREISVELGQHLDEIARRCEALGLPAAKKNRRKSRPRSPKQ